MFYEMVKTFWIPLIAAVQLSTTATGRELKSWRPNTNLDEPTNWLEGRVPCSADSVHVNGEHKAYYLNSSISMKELYLPYNGQLLMRDFVTLEFGGSDPSCPAQTMHFVQKESSNWNSPENWCVIDHLQERCPTAPAPGSLPSLLHSEQVPCRGDTAQFPKNSAFDVSLVGARASLNEFRLGEEIIYSTTTLKKFFATALGKLFFKYPGMDFTPEPDINVTQSNFCSQPKKGCPCGNDLSPSIDIICKNHDCPASQPTCDTPFTPVGHCCRVCGGMLVMKVSILFDLKTFKEMIYNTYLNRAHRVRREVSGQYKIVEIASMRSDGRVQVLLLDSLDGSKAAAVAGRIAREVNKGDLGIIDISVTQSHDLTNPEASTGGLSGGGVAGLVVGLLLLVALIAAASFFLHRRNQQQPLSLKAIFRKQKDENAIELDTQVSKSSQGFSNPGYDLPHTFTGVEVVDFDPKTGSFDNPIYDSPINALYQDPTKGDPTLDLGASGYGLP